MSKEYVQDKLSEKSSKIVDLILNRNAHVFVCGRKVLANEVIDKLKSFLAHEKRFENVDQAEIFFQDMKTNNRYHEDLFSS